MSILLVLLFTYRLISSYYSPITDCDEVFNYWEPLIFASGYYDPVLSSSNDRSSIAIIPAMQTWEYASEYALRTYAFLTPLAQIARGVVAVVGWPLHSPQLFFCLRSLIAACTAWCELRFAQAVGTRLGEDVGKMLLVMTLLSPGFFHSASSFLPSTVCMQVSESCWASERQSHILTLSHYHISIQSYEYIPLQLCDLNNFSSQMFVIFSQISPKIAEIL